MPVVNAPAVTDAGNRGMKMNKDLKQRVEKLPESVRKRLRWTKTRITKSMKRKEPFSWKCTQLKKQIKMFANAASKKQGTSFQTLFEALHAHAVGVAKRNKCK